MSFFHILHAIVRTVLLDNALCSCSKIVIVKEQSQFLAAKLFCVGCRRLCENTVRSPAAEQIIIVQSTDLRCGAACEGSYARLLYHCLHCQGIGASVGSHDTHHAFADQLIGTGNSHVLEGLVVHNSQFYLLSVDTACCVVLVHSHLYPLVHTLPVQRIVSCHHRNKANLDDIALIRGNLTAGGCLGIPCLGTCAAGRCPLLSSACCQ